MCTGRSRRCGCTFQSTRPLRGETLKRGRWMEAIKFSIHSPLAGRDCPTFYGCPDFHIFNPLAPCGARHGHFFKGFLLFRFSIHSPLAGRDGRPDRTGQSNHGFQSTRPLRGETRSSGMAATMRIFQSTRPLRGETMKHAEPKTLQEIFNPLAPCGARQQTITKIVCKRYSCCTVHFPTNPPRGASGRKTGCASRKTGIHLVRTYREFGVYCRFASQDQRFIHRKDG